MTSNFQQTRSGVFFEVGNLRPEQVKIKDITYRLARIIRFGGDAESYSVAHHSLAAAALARHLGYSEAAQAACLVHDLHEAYVGDISTPMKRVLGESFRVIDRQAQEAVLEALGMTEIFWDHHDTVKRIDALLLHAEARAFYPSPPSWVHVALANQVPREILFLSSPARPFGGTRPGEYELETELYALGETMGVYQP